MKVRSVRADARRRCFEVATARGKFEFPWTELDVVPSAADPVVEVTPDPELGNEGFLYRLASGAEDEVLLDQVLYFNREPETMRKDLLYHLTCDARDRLAASGRAKRSVARQMGTSLAQIARLLDTTNYRKSLDEMVRLLGALGSRVEVTVAVADPRMPYGPRRGRRRRPQPSVPHKLGGVPRGS